MAFDWVRRNRDRHGLNVRVLNISLGVDDPGDYRRAPLAWAAEQLWNDGDRRRRRRRQQRRRRPRASTSRPPIPSSSRSARPTRAGTADPADDRVADFSSRSDIRGARRRRARHQRRLAARPRLDARRGVPGRPRRRRLLPRQRHLAGRRGRLRPRGAAARRSAPTSPRPAQGAAAGRRRRPRRPAPSADGAGRVDAAPLGRRCRPRRPHATAHQDVPEAVRGHSATSSIDEDDERVTTSEDVESDDSWWAGRRWSGRRWSGRRWSGMKWSGRRGREPSGTAAGTADARGALGALTSAIALAAVALFVVRGPRSGRPTTSAADLPWWALALAFAATELFVVHAHVRGSAHSLSISELPLILGLLLASPQDLVIAQVLGPGRRCWRSRAGTRRSSSPSTSPQFGLTACLAVITLHVLAPAAGRRSARSCGRRRSPPWRSARSTGATLVFAAIALSEGVIPSRRLALMMGADLLVAMTNTSVGLARRRRWRKDPRAGWLLLAPACILLLAYRAYLSERTKHESLEFLYGVARSLSRAPDIETALVDLLRRTRESFRVRGGRDRAVLRRRHAAAHVARRRRARRSAWSRSSPRWPTRCASASGTSRRRLVEREHVDGQLARYMELRGIEQALVAPVPGRDAADRRDGAGRPRSARSARSPPRTCGCSRRSPTTPGISLEYDRLEQAVTRMRELQARLEHQAYRDSLTGLGNRALFLRRLEDSLAAGGREHDGAVPRPRRLQARSTTSYGHAAGDAVIAAAAERIARVRAARRPRARGSAATSSRCCWRTSTTTTPRRSRRACSSCWPRRCPVARGDGVGARQRRHRLRARGLGRGRRADPPGRRRDVPRQGGRQGPGARVVARRCTRRSWRARRGATRSTWRWRPASWSRTSSRSSRSPPARSSPPRRWRAGSTRATACSARPPSCPPPRPPARSWRSTAWCSSTPAARRSAGTARTGRSPAGASVHANLSGVGLRTFEVVADGGGRARAHRAWRPARLVLEITESVLVGRHADRAADAGRAARPRRADRARRLRDRLLVAELAALAARSTSSRSPSRSSTAPAAPRTTAR